MSNIKVGAVVAQLSTVADLIPSTVQIYKETETIQSIAPNLAMIQTAIEALVKLGDQEAAESVDLGVELLDVADGITSTCTQTDNHHVVVTLEGRDIIPGVSDTETFGDIPNAIDMSISLPVICGKYYKVKQTNPMLAYYDGKDEYVKQNSDGDWVKEKSYFVKDEDEFEYSFLIGEGRNTITININDGDVVIDIIVHIHFKKD